MPKITLQCKKCGTKYTVGDFIAPSKKPCPVCRTKGNKKIITKLTKNYCPHCKTTSNSPSPGACIHGHIPSVIKKPPIKE